MRIAGFDLPNPKLKEKKFFERGITGIMYICLGQQDSADLITPLRKIENNELLKKVIYKAISRKPKGHDFVIDRDHEEKYVPRHMNVTGG